MQFFWRYNKTDLLTDRNTFTARHIQSDVRSKVNRHFPVQAYTLTLREPAKAIATFIF